MLSRLTPSSFFSDDEWFPYLSLEDVFKLDDMRQALHDNDLALAAKFGRVYTLKPVVI